MEKSIPLSLKFEQLIIFRLARWLPLGMGGVAFVALLLAVIALAYSFRPIDEPSVPTPISPPAEISLSLADLKKALPVAVEEAPTEIPSQKVQESEAEKELKKNAAAFGIALGQLKDLLNDRGVAFTDEMKVVCNYFSSYTNSCLMKDEKLARKGVGPEIIKVTRLYTSDVNAKTETVRIPNSSLTVGIGLDDSIPKKISVLKELISLLGEIPSQEAIRYVHAWIKLRIEGENARRAMYESKKRVSRINMSRHCWRKSRQKRGKTGFAGMY